jgi:hypothetical protein
MAKTIQYSECFETTLSIRVEVRSDNPNKVKGLLRNKVNKLLEEVLNNEYENGEAESVRGITWKKDF